MTLRTVFERDSLSVSESPGEEQITPGQYARLGKLEPFLPKGTLSWTANGVRLGSYCGVIALGEETIEILPKVFRDGRSTVANRALLLHLLCLSRERPWARDWEAGLEHQRMHLLEVFIWKFAMDLNSVLAGGLARSYRELSSETGVLRGRLDTVDLSRRPPGRMHRMVCRHDVFDEDIPLNRILRYCLEKLSRRVQSAALRNFLDELRFRFEDVAPIHYRPTMLSQVRLDRATARFQGVWAQTCRLLRGLFPDATSGEIAHSSLLFDMESLFEEAVFRRMRKELGPMGIGTRFQGPQQYLLRVPTGSGFRRRMKPDIIIEHPSGGRIVVDCKWKLLDGEGDAVSQLSHADLYQLHTYATEYGAKAVALAYPWLPGLPEDPLELRFHEIGIPLWIHFIKMDAFNSRLGKKLTEGWGKMMGLPE